MAFISIVIPCFDEEAVIQQTYEQLVMALQTMEHRFEIIFVDDGSRDNTSNILQNICSHDIRCRAVMLSRNFGHQIALCAGLDAASGDAIVMMDADLQDPPSLIPQLIAKWQEGYDVVHAKRLERAAEPFAKRFAAQNFYHVFNWLSKTQISSGVADFRLIDRRIADILRQMPEQDRFLRGMIPWIGFKQTEIAYSRNTRAAGSTHYSASRMFRLASDGIFSFSCAPLRLATYGGVLSVATALGGFIHMWLWPHRNFPHQANNLMPFALMFFSGIQLLCLGIIGEYLGRLYHQGKNRPLYLVRQIIGG